MQEEGNSEIIYGEWFIDWFRLICVQMKLWCSGKACKQ